MNQDELDTIINTHKSEEVKVAETSLKEKIEEAVSHNWDSISLTYSEKRILEKNNSLNFKHLIRDDTSAYGDGHTLYFRHIDKILELEKKEDFLCKKINFTILAIFIGIGSLWFL